MALVVPRLPTSIGTVRSAVSVPRGHAVESRRGPAGSGVAIGSTWRCTSFHPPLSRRNVIVTRSVKCEGFRRSATRAVQPSTSTRQASWSVAWVARVSKLTTSPSLNLDEAKSSASATWPQPHSGSADRSAKGRGPTSRTRCCAAARAGRTSSRAPEPPARPVGAAPSNSTPPRQMPWPDAVHGSPTASFVTSSRSAGYSAGDVGGKRRARSSRL
jgi:hypothetical protein